MWTTGCACGARRWLLRGASWPLRHPRLPRRRQHSPPPEDLPSARHLHAQHLQRVRGDCSTAPPRCVAFRRGVVRGDLLRSLSARFLLRRRVHVPARVVEKPPNRECGASANAARSTTGRPDDANAPPPDKHSLNNRELRDNLRLWSRFSKDDQWKALPSPVDFPECFATRASPTNSHTSNSHLLPHVQPDYLAKLRPRVHEP